MKQIVILDGYTENPGDLTWEGFEALGEVSVYDRTPAEQVVSRIGEAEIVIVNKTPITRENLNACPKLRYIGVLATGYNVIDVEAAKEKGIVVTNIPTYGTTAVAQFVFALLLEICHHAALHSEAVKKGEWQTCPDFCFWKRPLIELAGKKLGIIGFGRIGQAVAKLGIAFGMEVLAFDAVLSACPQVPQARLTTLEEVLAQADVISLHCPLLESTRGIICKESIAKMKDGAIIINTSRGPLIIEEDLAEALRTGKVLAAGMDVLNVEPPKEKSPLFDCENCLITPHIAWAPKESRERLMNIAVDNLFKFLEGAPVNVVNR